MDSSDQPTLAVEGVASEPSSWEAPPLAEGRLGRYELQELLGTGGMGEVFRAFDPKLGRDVALKRWKRRRGPAPVPMQERIRREARAMARLSHPNVVPVYDVEFSSDGLLIAMQYVDGTNLRGWFEEAPPWREVVRVLVEAGRGLGAAHEAGLIHRDFKPANVLIGRDGRARVTDFGLASENDDVRSSTGSSWAGLSGDSGSQSLTQAGTVMGTPVYMAPEQHRGNRCTPASDQFAFCVTLFEGLYGVRPFSTGGRALVRAKQREAFAHPPAGSGVPRSLFKIIARGLSADPQQRWPSMESLLRRLERASAPQAGRRTAVVAGVLVMASGGLAWTGRDSTGVCDGPSELDEHWTAQRRVEVEHALTQTGATRAPAIAASVVERIDAFAGQWAVARDQWCEGGPPDARADQELACLRQQLDRLDAIVSELERADAKAMPRTLSLADSLPDPAQCSRSDEPGARPMPDDPALAVEVDRLRRSIEAADAALAVARFEAADDQAQRIVAQVDDIGFPPLRAEALGCAGRASAAVGELDRAERELGEAYFLAVKLGYARVALDASIRLVEVVGDQLGRPVDAQVWIRRAQTEVTRAGDRPNQAAMLASFQGRVLEQQEQWEEAEVELRRALDLYAQGSASNEDRAGVLKDLATVVKNLERPEEAEELLLETLALLRKQAVGDHPSVAITLDELGVVQRHLGRTEEALRSQLEALHMEERLFGEDAPRLATNHTNIAVTLGYLQRHDEAIEHLQRSIEMIEQHLGPDHPDLARTSSNLAAAYTRSGNREAAAPLLLRAHDIFVRTLGAQAPQIAVVCINLADVYLALGRIDDAAKFAEEANQVAAVRDLPGLLSASIEFNNARVMWERGQQRSEAETIARRALQTMQELGEPARRERDQLQEWVDTHSAHSPASSSGASRE
jgi:tetratricopeptide (TPR) repeat protein/predicted Ser/Thr protein kinase